MKLWNSHSHFLLALVTHTQVGCYSVYLCLWKEMGLESHPLQSWWEPVADPWDSMECKTVSQLEPFKQRLWRLEVLNLVLCWLLPSLSLGPHSLGFPLGLIGVLSAVFLGPLCGNTCPLTLMHCVLPQNAFWASFHGYLSNFLPLCFPSECSIAQSPAQQVPRQGRNHLVKCSTWWCKHVLI